MKTHDARSLPSVAQEDLRMKAVNAVLEGRTHVEVARMFNVTRHSVDKWVHLYNLHGKKGLRAQERGRPKHSALLPWQAALIVRTIEDHCPDQIKLPFVLWTRQAVQELITRRLGIQRSIWTIGRWLAAWGFTPQKPARRALEQNPEAVKKWLDAEYPSVKEDAKRENATIFWADETGIRSDDTRGRTYGRQGHTPVVPDTGQRYGCNVISAVANHGDLTFMVYKRGFTTRVMLKFLMRLVRHSSKKVYLVVDRHPVHRSRGVRTWVEKHRESIRLIFLPPYSPELNPDEMVNQDIKKYVRSRVRSHNQKEMMSRVRHFLRSRQRRPGFVRRYFQAKQVRYAADDIQCEC